MERQNNTDGLIAKPASDLVDTRHVMLRKDTSTANRPDE